MTDALDEAFLDEIYEAAVMPDRWMSVLGRITDEAGALGTILFAEHDKRHQIISNPAIADVVQEWLDSEFVYDNPRGNILIPMGTQGFLTDTHSIPAEIRKTHPYFTKLLAKHRMGWCVGTTIRSPSGDLLVFSSERSLDAGPVPEDAAQLLNLYRPHIARSALIAARFGLERANATVGALEAVGLPAAVVSRSCKILAANDAFASYGGSLDIGRGDIVRMLASAAVAEVVFGQGLSIPVRVEGKPPGVLHAVPMRGGAVDVFSGARYLLYVTALGGATSPDGGILLALFDLTPAEAGVVRSLFQGMSTKDIALQKGVQENTVRAHLKSIFAKTGVRDRAGLVQRLGVAGASDQSQT
jgi:DNA-binding CsgD family transcriptional regulator